MDRQFVDLRVVTHAEVRGNEALAPGSGTMSARENCEFANWDQLGPSAPKLLPVHVVADGEVSEVALALRFRSSLQCVAGCYSVLQMCCSVLQRWLNVSEQGRPYSSVWGFFTLCRSVLQRVAICCRVLQ